MTEEQRDKIADIAWLIAPEDERRAFFNMLEHRLYGRELRDGELRRVAEKTWREFLLHCWTTGDGLGGAA